MSIYIQAQRVVIQQPPTRAIHPDIEMNNRDFLCGYAVALKNGLHPDGSGSHIFTDEDMIEAIKECVMEEPETLPYVIGCYVGGIIARCQSRGE